MDVDAVLALAPDQQVAASAAKLTALAGWDGLGRDESLLWGLCRGSGKTPYQVCVDLGDRTPRCSCPSRKFPCKHALALQLLHAQDKVAADVPPQWAGEWLARREARTAPVEPDSSAEALTRRAAASARTAAKRAAAVQAGVTGLREWLADLAAGGIAGLPSREPEWWRVSAARMVDAKAPGLAESITELSAVVRAGGRHWAEIATDRIGGLHLLATIAPDPPAELAGVVRRRLGFTVREEEVRAGEGWTDHWVTLLLRDSDDGRIRTVQQWAWARQRREWVTVQRHGVLGGPGIMPALPLGGEFEGTLHPYPAGLPRRMSVGDMGEVRAAGAIELPADWTSALAGLEPALVADPWQRRHPLGCQQVRLGVAGNEHGLVDAEGRWLPVRQDSAVDRALALHGGGSFDAVCLWNGWTLTLGAVAAPGEAPVVLT
ncbi:MULTISPECIES: SWIM zinc finger family protein [unclassified Crossiella]|uniref:SWIM zinc finger family protein n=1 Tax=unclassified Crossiella TaxID=2620835 RepID=UPI001FFF9F99|nr:MULTISPECIES: SWIM zinc finger family protein [unclassified Crossiella]MCK2236352.1 SWIM zinc finger domain-containing protein [Crossiella sp. S99.2]MCK2250019.1 SWIM zinc finger domain-containing protein [Crossiella sp. S99.1]